jgi:hypothetical protein
LAKSAFVIPMSIGEVQNPAPKSTPRS